MQPNIPKKRHPKRIMDVAAPGHARPLIGSKPMSIGHRSVRHDPMMQQRRTISLRSLQQKPDSRPERSHTSTTAATPIGGEQMDTAHAEHQQTLEEHTQETLPEPGTIIEFDPLQHAQELDAGLSAITPAEALAQPTTQKPKRLRRRLFVIGLILCVLGLGGAYAAADLELIDPGFMLPVDFFKKSEPASASPVQAQPLISSQVEEEKDAAAALTEPTDTSLLDTSKWFTYQNERYEIRIPDGWTLQEKEGASGMYIQSSLEYREGTPAVVKPYSNTSNVPREIMSSLIIDVVDVTAGAATCQQDSLENSAGSFTFKTVSDLTVFSTVVVGTIKAEERSLGDVIEGETQHLYCVSDQTRQLYVSYLRGEAEVDARAYVEAMIKSVTFTAAN